MLNLAVDITYFVTAFVFIYGLKQMSSPVTARGGIVIAGIAMVAATLITFADPQIHLVLDINMILMLSAIAAGSAVASFRVTTACGMLLRLTGLEEPLT